MAFYDLWRMSIITLVVVSAGFSQRMPSTQRHVKETFLAGSEFEESMLTHLLNSSDLISMDDDISSLLSSSNLSYTLSAPDKPFIFVDRKYFWSQEKFVEYADSDNATVFAYTCVFNVTQDDGIFSQIFFPSGEPINEIVFGCESSKECCGMKCCGDDVLINIIIVGAISFALLFLLLCNILIGFKKRREKDRKDVTTTYQATETTNNGQPNEIVSVDQITYRHPAIGGGQFDDRIESLPNENPTKRV